jgi:hypothetical protein
MSAAHRKCPRCGRVGRHGTRVHGQRESWCYRCAETFYSGVQAVAEGRIVVRADGQIDHGPASTGSLFAGNFGSVPLC